ncbi:hypothetical protein ACP6ZN_004965, partial [Enterobacter cloacae]
MINPNTNTNTNTNPNTNPNTSAPPGVTFSTRRLRATAWLCLSLQLLSVSGSALSAVAAAATAPVAKTALTPADLMALPATPYVLRDGETPASVAATFGLTAAQLQTFNQLRTFRVPFAQLHAGDEIDVPVMSRRGSGTATDGDSPAAPVTA